MKNKKPYGKVIIAGFGPGDIELLTLKTHKYIQVADVIVYDNLIDAKALDLAKTGALKIYMGKRSGQHSFTQEEINQKLVELAHEHDLILRLKGGDPFVFGRGGEEALALLEHQIPFEIVPGISSSMAGPLFAGIPVTHRNLAINFSVISGHESEDKIESSHNWKAYAGMETLVFLMGVGQRQQIARLLIEHGRDAQDAVAFIESATRPQQRIVRTHLKELAEKNIFVESPAVMVVGPVAALNLLSTNVL